MSKTGLRHEQISICKKTGRLIEVSHPVRSGAVIISLADQGDGDAKSNAIGMALRIGCDGGCDGGCVETQCIASLPRSS